MIKIHDKIKIFFNKHSKNALEKRGSLNGLNFKLYFGIESRPNSNFHIIKAFLRNGNDILPCRIFNKDNVTYIKVLTFLDENRFFMSANLNFGTNFFVQNLKNYEVDYKESFFDYEEDAVKKLKIEDIKWDYRIKEINYKPKKFLNVKGRHNLIMQKYKLPISVKTFSGKFIIIDKK